jgi:hypothetical protein
MPDLRDKKQAKLRERKKAHKHHWPGSPNDMPEKEAVDSTSLPGDIARDISNEGVMSDPKHGEQRLNP